MKTAVTLFLIAGLTAPLAAQQHGHAAPSDSAQGMGMSCPMMGMSGMMDGMQMGDMMGAGGGMGMMGGNMTMMSRAMMAGMHLTPSRVLDLSDSLGLTDEQLAQIRELDAQPADAQAAHEAMQQRFEALGQALGAETPDAEVVRSAAEAALTMHAQWQAQRLATAAAVRAVLTPEQRDRLRTVAGCSMSGSSHGMMRHGATQAPNKRRA